MLGIIKFTPLSKSYASQTKVLHLGPTSEKIPFAYFNPLLTLQWWFGKPTAQALERWFQSQRLPS